MLESIRRNFNSVSPKYIEWDFYSQYIDREPPFGQLGLPVFIRTYSRYLPAEHRREKWCEVVLRVVEYSLSLDTVTTTYEKKIEARLMFDDLYNMRSLPAGRTLWVANTPIVEKDGSANFNCTARTVHELSSLVEGFYLLLVGAGFGFSVEKKYTNQLPPFFKGKTIVHKPYEYNKYADIENTYLTNLVWSGCGDGQCKLDPVEGVLNFALEIEKGDDVFADDYKFGKTFSTRIEVGDSKEGWVMALKSYLAALTSPSVKVIEIDYNNVRPEGSLLKTFGGRSSGPQALQTMFETIAKVVEESNEEGQQLRPIQVMDIANCIGLAVVVGGVRRCLPKGTLVHLKSGLTPIEEVEVGDLVTTSKGYSKVTNVFEQGVQQLVSVKTQLGEFKCTSNHQIAVLTDINGNYTFKKASDLMENDRIIFVDNTLEGQDTNLPPFVYEKPKHSTTCKDIVLQDLDEDLAYFLGYLHGNGCVKLFNKNGYTGGEIDIAIPTNLPQVKERLEHILSRYGVNVRCKPYNPNDGCFKLTVKSKQLALYFSQFKKTKTNIVVPDFILKGSVPIRKSYLSGLTEADGSFKNASVCLVVSVYPDFLKQVQCLFASLGYPTMLKKQRDAVGKWKTLYSLTLTGKRFVDKYDEEFFGLIEKFEEKRDLSKSNYGYGYPSQFILDAKLNYNGQWDSSCEQMTVDRFEKITGIRPKLVPIRVYEVVETDELELTYDLEVDEAHEFVCDAGYLVHNSSELCLADIDDDEIRNAKKDLWTDPTLVDKRTTRVMSNNSLALYENPGLKWFEDVMEAIRTTGEPGFISVGNTIKKTGSLTRKVFNPCFAAGTMVLTRKGNYPIEQLVGKTVEVFDGNHWVEIDNFRVTGENQEVWELQLDGFYSVFATPYHTFITNSGERKQLKELTVGEVLKDVHGDTGTHITSIKYHSIEDKVYCCTVPTNNSFTLTYGLLVGQCGEISMDDRGVCNLTEVYLPRHLTEQGVPNYDSLKLSLTIATRIGMRMTLVKMFHSGWDYIQNRDRLLGVSLSGIVDFFDSLNMPEKEMVTFLQWCRKQVHETAEVYANRLGVNLPLLMTTVKPSGTLSTLVGCGSGVHRLYAPYYLRRIRVSVNDPIALALKDMGIPVNPENGQGDHIDDDGVNTWVFTFGVKSNTPIKAIDESALIQMERYKLVLNNYVDHNVSFTCSVADDEWMDVAQWLYENYDSFIGVSFLPKFDSTNSPYPQLPYEACDEGTYNELVRNQPTLSENEFLTVLSGYEKGELYDILDADCSSGACPVR